MLCIHFWGSKLPMYLCVKWSMKRDHGKIKCFWGLPADLRHSGLLAIIATSDWHKTHRVVGWLLPSWSSWCKTATCLWVTSSLPALQLQSWDHVSNVFLISSTFGFYLNVKRREKSTFWGGKGQLRQETGRGTPLSGITTKAVKSKHEVS